MDFSAVFGAVKESPTGALLVLALMALAWISQQFITYMREQHAAHLATAMLVVPLAQKLADVVVLAERLASPRSGGPS